MPTRPLRARASHSHYARDGRSPIPKSESVSRTMSANRGSSTRPELALRRALRRSGLAGFRVNVKGLPGRPDVAFPRAHVAVFLHGCFWHRCPYCRPALPKNNADFWKAKFDRNRARDAAQVGALRSAGWRVLVVWECQLRRAEGRAVARVAGALSRRGG